MTIKEAIADYLDLMNKSGYSAGTISTKQTVLNNFLSYLEETTIKKLVEVDEKVISSFLIFLKKRGLKESSIKENKRRLKEFFKYLLERKKIEVNPFAKEKKEYPAEFTKYMAEYLRIKELEDTCFNSMKKIKQSLNRFYEYLLTFEITKHSEVKKDILKGFIKYLVDLTDEKGNPVYQNTSVNRILASLNPYIQWLSKKGIFPVGFSSCLAYLKKSQRLTRNVLTRKELVSLFSLNAGSLYELMMKLVCIVQYASGLRINELLSIKLSDIDFENYTLQVFESKTHKERVVQVGEVGAKYLKIFVDEIREKVCFNHQTSDRVFLSCYEGKTLNDNTVNNYLKKFCKKAGITKLVTCHCFRHSYGTHLLENGLGIKEVSDLMGHNDLTSTEQYTRLSPERLRLTINNFHPLEREV